MINNLSNQPDIEELKKALYINETLVEPAYQLYRMTSQHDGRFYWRMNGDGTFSYYASVTTVEKQTSGPNHHLIDWMLQKGKELAEYERDSASEYGTFMHATINVFNVNGRFPIAEFGSYIDVYSIKETIRHGTRDWTHKGPRDLLAWMQFCWDYEVVFLAIEVMLCDDELEMAGAIDVVCEITIMEDGFHGEMYKSGPRKGEPKLTKAPRRVRCIIDLKSGRKGFYDANVRQVKGYELLWNRNYPQYPVEKLFNWSPKDWRKQPDYNFTDQTGKVSENEWMHMVGLYKERHGKSYRTTREVFTKDVLVMGESAEGVLVHVPLEDYMRETSATKVVDASNFESVGDWL